MCGRNLLRYISTTFLVVLIFIVLCGLAMAEPSSSQPVQSTTSDTRPAGEITEGAAPSITSISPNTGRQGNYVTLVGANFGSTRGTSYVSFGPFKCVSYSTWSDTQIACLVPPITGVTFPVTGSVTVTTAAGTSNPVSFTALAPNPTVSSIYPPAWASNSSVTITITGTGFQKGATVVLSSWGELGGGPDITPSRVTVASSTRISCNIRTPKWSEIPSPTLHNSVPYMYLARVSNPDGGSGTGGSFMVVSNPCGAGAISPIIGIGLVMGIMTLAGTVRARKRRARQ
jgi:IPT/TIG domain